MESFCMVRDIRKNTDETAFSVDVSGVNVLTVAASNNGSYDYGHLYLTSALGVKDGTGEAADIQRLADLILVEEVGTYTEQKLYTDVYGILHDRLLELNAQENARALYNLSGNYDLYRNAHSADGGGRWRQMLLFRLRRTENAV